MKVTFDYIVYNKDLTAEVEITAEVTRKNAGVDEQRIMVAACTGFTYEITSCRDENGFDITPDHAEIERLIEVERDVIEEQAANLYDMSDAHYYEEQDAIDKMRARRC